MLPKQKLRKKEKKSQGYTVNTYLNKKHHKKVKKVKKHHIIA